MAFLFALDLHLLAALFLGYTNRAQADSTLFAAQAIASPPEGAAARQNALSSESQAIPLTQIADRAEELDRLLREIENQLIPETELTETRRQADLHAQEIGKEMVHTRDLLAGIPSPLEFEDEQRYWRYQEAEFSAQRKVLTELAANLAGQLQLLGGQQPEWQATWDQIKGLTSIAPIINRVRQELDAIQAMRVRVQAELNLILTLQNQVAQQEQQVSDLLSQIRQHQARERKRLLEADSRPIWQTRGSDRLDHDLRRTLYRSLDRSIVTGPDFLRERKLAILGLSLVYGLLVLGLYKLKSQLSLRQSADVAQTSSVLNAPFSTALLICLLIASQGIALAPIGVVFLFYGFYLIPILRLLVPLTDSKLKNSIYAISCFYVLTGVESMVQVQPLLRRWLHMVIVLTALVSFYWLSRPSRLGPVVRQRRSRQAQIIGIRAGLAVLFVSLVANIVGYFALAQVLELVVFVGGFISAGFYCGARVLIPILKAMRTALAKYPEVRADAVELWGIRILVTATWLFWLRAILQSFTIYSNMMSVISEVLRTPIGFDNLRFTTGGALSVLLILVVGYGLANVIALVVRKVVLPRFALSRGVPDAISTIGYYFLLLLVVLATISAAGVQLNRFTVLTGALGVGLGFGLQNIVNNFVSGLILLCERPIHVGDTVDVGGLLGTVRRIGARASTVVTFQGAEVIVPNSNLIANQVINWTLSSPWRRVDVAVGVAYGTDPEQVLQLLVRVAESHPGVLRERPPVAFFLGFGESSLKFELRFWSARQDTWFQLQSDVTVAVAKALGDAGIEIPFPQRDLHIRSIAATEPGSFAKDLNKSFSSASERSSGS